MLAKLILQGDLTILMFKFGTWFGLPMINTVYVGNVSLRSAHKEVSTTMADQESDDKGSNGACGGSNATETAAEAEKMSKRALKRKMKRETWLEGRAERRKEEKKKKKAKMEKARAEGKYETTFSQHRKRLKQMKMVDSGCKIRVALDYSFGHLMNQRDCGKSLKQLMHCYAINRRLENPMQMFVTGFVGQCESEMKKHSGYENWDCHFSKESYTEVFGHLPKNNIVYLTSESENVVGDSLDESKVYVIGGLVDHNNQKGLCYDLAKEKGIGHARLPIGENIDMKTRKVLTIDHVFKILAAVGSEGKSWKDALLETLPERKGAKTKSEEAK